MSIQLIRQYHTKVDKIIRYGGSRNESALRKPFQDLLEQYARSRNLEMIAELDFQTRFGTVVYPVETLKDALRQDWGYWERKPRDPTIREKFNSYDFRDYKESVIDLLGRVCTVSVETMRIVAAMGHQKKVVDNCRQL